jgi:5-methylcytosine-specific restriction endonuclease McrA
MASKFLASLSADEYQNLTEKLLKIQSNLCFICQEEIKLNLHNTNIDHIVPLVNKDTKDNEDNFAVAHESCNKSKQDANLNIARILCKLK